MSADVEKRYKVVELVPPLSPYSLVSRWTPFRIKTHFGGVFGTTWSYLTYIHTDTMHS